MEIGALALLWCCLYAPILYLVVQYENSIVSRYIPKDIGDNCRNDKKPCRFCGTELVVVLDFGQVALAGGFLKPEHFKEEKKYPLRLCFCESCYSVQLADRVEPDVMFRDYFYFSSATETIRDHFRQYAREVVERFNPKTVIEIGCNDGVLIGPLREAGVRAIGVDPSSTVPVGDDIVNDYFTDKVAKEIGRVDLVIANNVFAHIDDIHTTTRAIRLSLKDDGVCIIEAHYLGDMISGLQYDWIYHEHIYYYSLLSLEKHFQSYGMRVFDVKPVKTHGGSMRYYISADRRPESQAVRDLRKIERESGLDRIETFTTFAARVERHRDELSSMLSALPGVVGYGASGRANTVIQYCGLNLDYIVDDAPAKHGFYTPGSHIPIKASSAISEERPDHVVVFAWTYADEIRKKCDLPMIVPFPHPHRKDP